VSPSGWVSSEGEDRFLDARLGSAEKSRVQAQDAGRPPRQGKQLAYDHPEMEPATPSTNVDVGNVGPAQPQNSSDVRNTARLQFWRVVISARGL
jgi:hypothetical protein